MTTAMPLRLLTFFILIGSLKLVAQNANPIVYIPNQAQSVIVFNTPSIIKKADIQALKQLEFVKNLLVKTESENKATDALIKNPMQLGVDFSKPLVMAIMDTENPQYEQMVIISPLSDFSKFDKAMQDFQRKIDVKNNISISKGDSNAIAWNKDIAVFTALHFKKEAKDLAISESDRDSTHNTEKPFPKLDPSVFFNKLEVNPRAEAIRQLMSESHDIYIYKNSDGSSKSPKAMFASMFLNINPDDLDGNTTHGWADFENGRIIFKTFNQLNKALKEKLGALMSPKPTINWNNYIAATAANQKPILTLNLSLNPSGIKQFISENPMLKQGVEKAQKKAQSDKFNFDNLMNLIGGDLFVSVSSFEAKPHFLLGISLKDKEAALKFMRSDTSAKEVSPNLFYFIKKPKKAPINDELETMTADSIAFEGNTMEGIPDSTYMGDTLQIKESEIVVNEDVPLQPEKPKTFLLFKDNVLLVGEEETVNSLISPHFKSLAPQNAWQESLESKPFSLFVDLKSLVSLGGGSAATERLDGIPVESMAINSGQGSSTFEINMIDKTKNALFSFAEMVDNFIKKKKEKERQMRELQKQQEEENRKRDSTIRN